MPHGVNTLVLGIFQRENKSLKGKHYFLVGFIFIKQNQQYGLVIYIGKHELAGDSMRNFCHFSQVGHAIKKGNGINETKNLQIYERIFVNGKIHQ